MEHYIGGDYCDSFQEDHFQQFNVVQDIPQDEQPSQFSCNNYDNQDCGNQQDIQGKQQQQQQFNDFYLSDSECSQDFQIGQKKSQGKIINDQIQQQQKQQLFKQNTQKQQQIFQKQEYIPQASNKDSMFLDMNMDGSMMNGMKQKHQKQQVSYGNNFAFDTTQQLFQQQKEELQYQNEDYTTTTQQQYQQPQQQQYYNKPQQQKLEYAKISNQYHNDIFQEDLYEQIPMPKKKQKIQQQHDYDYNMADRSTCLPTSTVQTQQQQQTTFDYAEDVINAPQQQIQQQQQQFFNNAPQQFTNANNNIEQNQGFQDQYNLYQQQLEQINRQIQGIQQQQKLLSQQQQTSQKLIGNKRKLKSISVSLPLANANKKKKKNAVAKPFNFQELYNSDWKLQTKNLVKGVMNKFADNNYVQMSIKQQELQDLAYKPLYVSEEYKNFVKNYMKDIKYTYEIQGIFSDFEGFQQFEIIDLVQNQNNQDYINNNRFYRICEIIGGFQQNKNFKIDLNMLLQCQNELQSFNEQVRNINFYNQINRLCMQRYLTFLGANQIYLNTKVRENRSYNYYALSLRLKKLMNPSELQQVKNI